MRVVMWILDRCAGKVDAVKTPIGYVPHPEDINIEGLDITEDTIKDLLTIDKKAWLDDCDHIEEFYDFIGDRVPAELRDELKTLRENLSE